MVRAAGKRQQRAVEPDTPRGDAIGLSARVDDEKSPVPGGELHVTRRPVARQEPSRAVPRPEFRGVMAHGVPPEEHTPMDRAEAMRGPDAVTGPAPVTAALENIEPAVPVYIVERGAGGRPLETATGVWITVPANTAEPIPICGRDLTRSKLKLMVETAAGSQGAAPTGIRVSNNPTDLVVGQGALFRAGMAGYEDLEVTDRMWALSADGSACTVSVVQVFGVRGAG